MWVCLPWTSKSEPHPCVNSCLLLSLMLVLPGSLDFYSWGLPRSCNSTLYLWLVNLCICTYYIIKCIHIYNIHTQYMYKPLLFLSRHCAFSSSLQRMFQIDSLGWGFTDNLLIRIVPVPYITKHLGLLFRPHSYSSLSWLDFSQLPLRHYLFDAWQIERAVSL